MDDEFASFLNTPAGDDSFLASAPSHAISTRAAAQFELPANRTHFRHAKKAESKANRRGIKRLIKPENARSILGQLPIHPADRLHCLLRGDFVLCDLIPALIAIDGPIGHMRVATLGLSLPNAEQIVHLIASHKIAAATIIVSHYFASVDATSTFASVKASFDKVDARLIVTRNHAKVILLPMNSGKNYVIEGSANLRSSDNIEQILILNDPETLAFHAGWIDDLASRHDSA